MKTRKTRRGRLQRKQPVGTGVQTVPVDAARTDVNASEPADVFPFISGLSTQQVQELQDAGKINSQVEPDSLTAGQIIRSNVFTYFNLIFAVIALCLIAVGSFRDLTFLPLIIFNTGIGILQELNAKAQLDKLKFMHAPKSIVIRDGKKQRIASDELVLGDIILLRAGDQIPADACVTDGEVRVNESLLTGEADEIVKQPEDELLSGSFVVSGVCRARLVHVGADSYLSKLTLEAKAVRKGEQSDMIKALTGLLKIVGIIIIPTAGFLFYQQYHINGLSMRDAVTATVAAVIGMIPEGLYLLASVAMAVSATRLAADKVLVHDMKSIESLARVDVLCVDKTGTITENEMTVSGIRISPASDSSFTEEEFHVLLGTFAQAQHADNATMAAMKVYFSGKTDKKPEQVFPFSSVYKYSAMVLDGESYILGAPQMVLRDQYKDHGDWISEYTECGYRVLAFGKMNGSIDGGALEGDIQLLGIVLLQNPIREGAAETFRYFEKQGVAVKVISGDDPMTVSRVALEAGIEGAEKYVDASKLRDGDLTEAVRQHVVFGRVTPQRKRELIAALKKDGHKVAMTGDGVNDVLALKDADCSVAMASGSDAAAHAAQMVLLESDFSKMPAVVDEGRRVVNNIERTASLFLVKNIFSVLMALLSIGAGFNYPLEPSQLSLISMFTIGVPAFILSLEPNHEIIRGRFLSNVLYRAMPAGLTDFIAVGFMVLACMVFDVPDAELSTGSAVIMMFVGLLFLYRVMQPMTAFHGVVWAAMVFGLWFCMENLPGLFAISGLSEKGMILTILCAAFAYTVLGMLIHIFAFIRSRLPRRA